jgi:hypothetical protein
MPRRRFNNISVDLLEYAEEAAQDFVNRGYQVKVEKDVIGFPYTPTLLCTRQNTTVIVEFYTQVLLDRINEWVAYARSSGRDTRVAVCISPTVRNTKQGRVIREPKITSKQERILRKLGVGIYLATRSGLEERVPPNDLALNIQLPSLASLPRKVRELLGPAYEQFNRSQWREGFEDACQAFENAARKYFKHGCSPKRRRIVLITRKGPKIPTAKEIGKMTMGGLATAFSQIQSQTHADQVIGATLNRINKDRVGVVHYKSKVRTESRLRTNVGQHMWAIIAALKEF